MLPDDAETGGGLIVAVSQMAIAPERWRRASLRRERLSGHVHHERAPLHSADQRHFAGRAYAAYGGIYIAASLVELWRWKPEPTRTDVLGAALAIDGAVVIVGVATRSR